MKTETLKNVMVVLAGCFALTACGVGELDDSEAAETGESVDEAALTANSHFEQFIGKDGQYYFHLIAGNGEKVLASQGYSSATRAHDGIVSVRTNGQDGARYDVRDAVDGSSYFVLASTNGAIIGRSEMYTSHAAAVKAVTTVVNVVKAAAEKPLAPVTGTRFETFKGLDGKYYFHLRAANGEILLQSQGYTTKTSATSGVASVKANGGTAARYEIRNSVDGQFYVVLKSSNGKVIAHTEIYTAKASAEGAVQASLNILAGRLE